MAMENRNPTFQTPDQFKSWNINFSTLERSALLQSARGIRYKEGAINLGMSIQTYKIHLSNCSTKMREESGKDSNVFSAIVYAMATNQLKPEDIIPEDFDVKKLFFKPEEENLLLLSILLGTTEKDILANNCDASGPAVRHNKACIAEKFKACFPANAATPKSGIGTNSLYLALRLQDDPQFLETLFSNPDFVAPLYKEPTKRRKEMRGHSPLGYALPKGEQIIDALRMLIIQRGVGIIMGELTSSPERRRSFISNQTILAVGATDKDLAGFMWQAGGQQGFDVAHRLLEGYDEEKTLNGRDSRGRRRYVLIKGGARWVPEVSVLMGLVDENGINLSLPDDLRAALEM